MSFIFGLLRTDVSPEAEAHNEKLLGENTLGIEVTMSALAEKCGLGNIDPQHNVDGGSSAIEEALVSTLPPDGSTLVTIRPDKDSVGAMAVLDLRRGGRESKIDKALVSWIGAIDRVGSRQANEKYLQLATVFHTRKDVHALNVIANDHECWPSLFEKVCITKKILCGEIPAEDIEVIISRKRGARSSFIPEMFGDVAVIEAPGKYREARSFANARAQVAVIIDPIYETPNGGRCRRVSVIRKSGAFDRRGFEIAINELEALARGLTVSELREKNLTWGGPVNIVSSSDGSGHDTVLGKDEIVKCVITHSTNGVVT